MINYTPQKGLHFSLDGVTQSVEVDEKTYHEALVHTPLLLYPKEPGPKSVRLAFVRSLRLRSEPTPSL